MTTKGKESILNSLPLAPHFPFLLFVAIKEQAFSDTNSLSFRVSF
jgi:hypothetical protein